MAALLDAGADPSHLDRSGMNLWHAAAISPSSGILDKLFENSKIIHLEARTSLGCTPLLYTVVVGRKENVEKLLARHANPAAQDDQGNGLLHWAATCVSPEMIKMLVQKCPALDINAPNSQGQTPLMRAAANGHHSSVAILLDCGCDPHAKDLEDQTVLHWLAWNGSFGILSVFRSKDIALDLEATSKWGKTPLLYAAENGRALIVEALLSQGADANAADAGQ